MRSAAQAWTSAVRAHAARGARRIRRHTLPLPAPYTPLQRAQQHAEHVQISYAARLTPDPTLGRTRAAEKLLPLLHDDVLQLQPCPSWLQHRHR